jgi:two-component system, NarL family, nitrate/nitrite response regulator NarL
MNPNILISSDEQVCARWMAAFDAAPCVTGIDAAAQAAHAQSLIWLHLPPSPQRAIDALMRCVAAVTPARVIALADVPSDEQALELMDKGAVAYCHSHAGAPMLQQVATVVANQGLWVGPNLLRRLIRSSLSALPPGSGEAASLDALSAREREVAHAVGRGASNKEIARELLITERTVKAHLSAIFMKMGVRDRLHLALLMRNQGN